MMYSSRTDSGQQGTAVAYDMADGAYSPDAPAWEIVLEPGEDLIKCGNRWCIGDQVQGYVVPLR
jgi:hypothetical protein